MIPIVALLTGLIASESATAQSAQSALDPEEFAPNSFWVLDLLANEIQGYTVAGEPIRTISNIADTPYGIAFGPDGKLYVSSSQGPKDIAVIDNLNSASFFGSEHLTRPKGLAFGPMGQLYVADDLTNSIVEFDANQNFVRSITAAGMVQPTRVAVGVDGHLFVATNVGDLLEIDPDLGVIDSIALSNIYDLTIDPSGNLWVTRFTYGVWVLDDDLDVTASFTTGQWTNTSATKIGPDHRMWVSRLGTVLINTLSGDFVSQLVGPGSASLITGLAIAPTRMRAKLTAKRVDATGKSSSKESVDIRFTPGSSVAYITFTDDVADSSDVVSWTNHSQALFSGFEVASSSDATQYWFRGTQQRLPARQSGSDALYLTVKGTLGSTGVFQPKSVTGTLDITYPTFQVHGTLK